MVLILENEHIFSSHRANSVFRVFSPPVCSEICWWNKRNMRKSVICFTPILSRIYSQLPPAPRYVEVFTPKNFQRRSCQEINLLSEFSLLHIFQIGNQALSQPTELIGLFFSISSVPSPGLLSLFLWAELHFSSLFLFLFVFLHKMSLTLFGFTLTNISVLYYLSETFQTFFFQLFPNKSLELFKSKRIQ